MPTANPPGQGRTLLVATGRASQDCQMRRFPGRDDLTWPSGLRRAIMMPRPTEKKACSGWDWPA
jgi:hypothetical protein